MRPALLIVCSLFTAVTAYADTDNVKKGKSQLDFRSANTSASRAAASASGGATASQPTSSEKEAMFRHLDIDGDGFVSKAEAAGNAPATLGFDRADRNKDGKLSFAEYDSIGKPKAAKKQQARAPRSGSASAGSTAPKSKPN
jgi:EF hand domain-containing protein